MNQLYTLLHSTLFKSATAWIVCCLLGLLAFSQPVQAQVTISLNITERDNLTTTPAGSLPTVRLNYSISSTTGNATGVKAVLNLPDDIRSMENIVGTSLAPTSNFVFDGTPGAKKVTITFVDPVPSGSTGVIDIGVRFTNGTIPNNTLETFTAVLTDGSGNTSGVQTLPITVTAAPTFCVNKTLVGGGAIDGITTYQIVARANNDPDAIISGGYLQAENITITDNLPTDAIFVSAAVYDQNNTLIASPTPTGNVLSFTLPTLSPSYGPGYWVVRSVRAVIQVRFPSPTFSPGDAATNSIGVTYNIFGGTQQTLTDGQTIGSCSSGLTTTTTLQASNPVATISKSLDNNKTQYFPGEIVVYGLSVKNTGNVDLDDYELIDDVPASLNLSYVYGNRNLTYQSTLHPTYVPIVLDGNDNVILATGEKVTKLRFTYGASGSPMPPNGVMNITLGFKQVGEVTVSTSFTNCAQWNSSTAGIPTDRTSCVVATQEPRLTTASGILRTETNVCGGVFDVGNQIAQKVFYAALPTGANIQNPIVMALLPVGHTFVAGSFTFDPLSTSLPTPTMEVLPSYNGTGRTLLRFRFPTGSVLKAGDGFFNINFTFRIGLGAQAGNGVGPDIYGYGDNIINGAYTDANDLNANGSTTDLFNSFEKWCGGYTVASSASMESIKWVKGQLDSKYSRYPESGNTVPGGNADYRLVVKNTGTVPMKNISIVDILPFVGDRGVIDPSARNTIWRPNLAGPLTPPSGVTVYYSTAQNPCRDELKAAGDPSPFPTGCTPPNWSTAPPADITTVQSLKLDFGTLVIASGDSLVTTWPMRAPINAPTAGEIAWNSFGFVATRTDNNQPLLAAEPIKVGIKVTPAMPAIWGDLVWLDTNKDGIKDAGESGVSGVKVTLYSASSRTPNPATDPQIGFTVTDNQGLYLFPNLSAGSYYAVFDVPPGYAISPNLAGSDRSVDSEGPITAIYSLAAGDDDRTHDLGIYVDLNCAVKISNATVSPCSYDPVSRVSRATVNVFVQWANAPAGQNITVTLDGANAQTINVMGGATSPALVSFTVLSDAANHTLNAGFNSTCLDSREITAPLPCAPGVCSVDISAVKIGACDKLNANRTVGLTVAWSNAPLGEDINLFFNGVNVGTILVSGGITSPAEVVVNLPADGTVHNLLAQFTTSTSCSVVIPVTVPVCQATCLLVTTATSTTCNPATNQYSATGTITLTDNTAGGVATITDGTATTTVTIAANTTTASYTLTGLTSDGASHTITVSLPGCGSATATYAAPTSCTVTTPFTCPGPAYLFLTDYNTGNHIFDLATANPANSCLEGKDAGFGEGVVIDYANNFVYVAKSYGAITKYNGSDGNVITTFNVLSNYSPQDVALSPDGQFLYIATIDNGGLLKYKTDGTFVSQTLLGTALWGVGVNPVSGNVFVTSNWNKDNGNSNIIEINPVTMTVVNASLASTPISGYGRSAFVGLTFANDGTFWVVKRSDISGQSDLVQRYSSTGTLLTSCSLGNTSTFSNLAFSALSAWKPAIGPDGKLYVASSDNLACVWQVDPASCTSTNYIPQPGNGYSKGIAIACQSQICLTALCSITTTATSTSCNPANNQYSATGTITLTNNTAGGTATITDGTATTTVTIAANATTASYTLTGLTSDGASHTITVSLPGCGSATATYGAPTSCTIAPPALAVLIGRRVCDPATNIYTTSGTVSLSNVPAGATLTITDNAQSVTVVTPATGQSTVFFSLTGVSDASSHTVTASLVSSFAGSPQEVSTTYTAPVACTVCSTSITTASLPNGQVGTAYSQTLTTIGGSAPLTYALTGTLPAGLSLNTTTGEISGTPTAPTGTASFTVTVTDAKSCSDAQPLTITTSAQPVCSLTVLAGPDQCDPITNTYFVKGTVSATNTAINGAATQSLTISVGLSSTVVTLTGDGPVSYTLAGLNSDGMVHTVTVLSSATACGSASVTYTAPASCTIAPPALVVLVGTPICNTATNNYTATGTVSLSNAITSTLTITDNGTTIGTISVTAGQTTASFSVSGISNAASHTVIATLTGGTSASAVYSAPVACTVCSLSLTTSALANGQIGSAYSQTLTTSGATAPVSFVLSGSLPSGLTLDPTTGVISGTPTAPAGTASFSVTVSDGKNCSAVAPLTITTSAQPVCSLTVLAGPDQCDPITNTYFVKGTVSATNTAINGAATQSLTISVGLSNTVVTLTGDGPVSFTLDGLDSDGLVKTLTVLSSATACGNASVTYTAPMSCTVAPPALAVIVGKPVCNSLTNNYTATGTVSLTNATAGTLTITDNGSTVGVVSVTAGQTTASFSTTGISDAASHTVIATLTGGTSASTTYLAPVSCTVCSTTLTSSSLPRGKVGNAYSATLTATNGTAPYSFSVSGGSLPTGLTLNPITGVISGTPTVSAPFPITIAITDASGCVAQVPLTVIQIDLADVCALSVQVTPGLCLSATNQYSISGTVSFTSAIVGTLTITDGAVSTSVTVTASTTSVAYSLSGLSSGSGSHIVTASLSNCGSTSIAYAAPASCSVGSPTYAISKVVDLKQVEKGGIVTYTVSVTNTSAVTATNLVLTDQLSSTAVTLVGSATASAGTFAPGINSGTWSISSLAGGQIATLSFQVQLNQEGITYNTLTAPNGQTATVCTTVPFRVCANDVFEFALSVPNSYSAYQWSLNGVPIAGATTNTLSATAIGEYTVTANGSGGCPTGACCPFIILANPAPSLTALAVSASCVGAVAQANAAITLVGSSTGAVSYNITKGSSFTAAAPLFASPQALSAVVGGVLLGGQPNPALAQDYTIRVYSANGCFADTMVSLQPALCNCPPPQCVPIVVKKTRAQGKSVAP